MKKLLLLSALMLILASCGKDTIQKSDTDDTTKPDTNTSRGLENTDLSTALPYTTATPVAPSVGSGVGGSEADISPSIKPTGQTNKIPTNDQIDTLPKDASEVRSTPEDTISRIAPNLTSNLGASDGYSKLEENNENFSQATILSNDKDYKGAIALLEKSKSEVSTPAEKSVVDFNISSNKFALDRIEGAEAYIELAKNTNYPVRTRALALQRVYLMYRKYNDESVLRAIADKMNIQWTSIDAVKLEYMKKIYALYPIPSATLYIMKDELKGVNTKEQARIIYQKYITTIDREIAQMKQNPGELAEATSGMLSKANIMGNLSRQYALFSREEVETEYKNLIEFDQKKLLNTNKQYSLLYYANFLADIKDQDSAIKVLNILLRDGIESSLKESLPKATEYTGLKSMTNISDKGVIELINFIGTKE